MNIGGAERQVVGLSKELTRMGHNVHVAVVSEGGPLESELAESPAIQFHVIGGNGIIGKFQYLWKLRSLISRERFDVVYGFLPVPNLATLVARSTRPRPAIVWGIRSSGLDFKQYSARVKWTMRLEKLLSPLTDLAITNSGAARAEYIAKGFSGSKTHHIPNAIDADRFSPDPSIREVVRNDLGINSEEHLVGIFARIHPMKDFENFLQGASVALKQMPTLKFVCAGHYDEHDPYLKSVRRLSEELGIAGRIIWAGPVVDPERLMNACDITTLTSDSGEGFPNSVAESMACGIPCVVTDIGDSALIVDDPEKVVEPKNPDQLAKAWIRTIENISEPKNKPEQIRSSIISRFSPESIATRTTELLGSVTTKN